MIKIRALTATACIAAALWLAIAPIASGQDEPEMSEEAMAEMQAWMELAQPGEHHEHLAPYAGKWKSDITMWMEPGGEPMTETAQSEARFVLGGRYLEWIHTGTFGGMPFEGRQIDAYNNGDQRYEATWTDNFGTLILYYTGDCEDDGKVRTLHTELSDPMSGETISQRAVYTWQDEDHWTYESTMSKGGVEYKNMEILYTRSE